MGRVWIRISARDVDFIAHTPHHWAHYFSIQNEVILVTGLGEVRFEGQDLLPILSTGQMSLMHFPQHSMLTFYFWLTHFFSYVKIGGQTMTVIGQQEQRSLLLNNSVRGVLCSLECLTLTLGTAYNIGVSVLAELSLHDSTEQVSIWLSEAPSTPRCK